ncbi:potassium channel family protein [Longispora albida]|uniref:potassium channel family protein n=1 Tax=Longispora albida TaxID=203523 RepID=UPI00037D343C|nr:potassium channel family protein [Longispora albida]
MTARTEPTNVRLPVPEISPLRRMGRRVLLALFLLLLMFVTVALDRSGYKDSADGEVSLLDALYYATVSLSTTGYGDVVPVSDTARLVNILIVTPLRVIFLVVLVGTTFEVLTERTRQQWRLDRWRGTLRGHTIVIGYGTKGRSAIDTLVRDGADPGSVVVVDSRHELAKEAAAQGYAGVTGDASRSSVLRQAGIEDASSVIVATDRDDTAVLVTLTARQLNPKAVIVVTVREAENAPLIRQSGATSVITSSEAAGRLLGTAMLSPEIADTVEDLLIPGIGLDIVERDPRADEVGRSPADCPALIVAVIREGQRFHYNQVETINARDQLVVITA